MLFRALRADLWPIEWELLRKPHNINGSKDLSNVSVSIYLRNITRNVSTKSNMVDWSERKSVFHVPFYDINEIE